MDISAAYLKKAADYLSAAVVEDQKGFKAEAIHNYTKGLEWLEMAAKYHPSQIERTRITEKICYYAERIQILKSDTKNHAVKRLEAKPLKRPCKVCNGGTLLQDLSFCNICTHHICPKCIHLCEVCNLPVCTNDLDRDVVGNVCFTHASPKETEKIKPNCFTQPIAANPPVAIEKPVILEQPKIQQEEKPEQSNAKECVICLDEIERPSAIDPCGHTNFCYDCLEGVQLCPICRGPITKILKLFG